MKDDPLQTTRMHYAVFTYPILSCRWRNPMSGALRLDFRDRYDRQESHKALGERFSCRSQYHLHLTEQLGPSPQGQAPMQWALEALRKILRRIGVLAAKSIGSHVESPRLAWKSPP